MPVSSSLHKLIPFKRSLWASNGLTICPSHTGEASHLNGALLQLHLLEAHESGPARLHFQVGFRPLLLPRLLWGSIQWEVCPPCSDKISRTKPSFLAGLRHVTARYIPQTSHDSRVATHQRPPGMLLWPDFCPGKSPLSGAASRL